MFFDWEVVRLRQRMPESLLQFSQSASRILVVPTRVFQKIKARHPTDVTWLERLGEILAGWEYVGLSPKGIERLEVYSRLDGVWCMAVIRLAETDAAVNVLITLHRVYERKVRGRVQDGYLKARPERK